VYHYGLSGQLMAETRIDSQTGKEIHKNYLWLNRVPVAMADDSKGQQITYLHTDHLNTPRKATNDQQTIVWQWNSDAFGMGLANQDPDGDGKETEINLRFAGQYYDHESGLFYNYHRYYDPETGRYSQSDPIGLRGGINTYAYVNSNPLVSTDPLGLFLFAFDGTGNDADDLGGLNAEAETNVSLFRRYYQDAYSRDDVLYQPGVGTDGWLDYIIGGATGLGSRERVNDALYMLDVLLRRDSWDRTIDIVGFSRGAAAAREFSNEIFERIDNNHWANVSECNPLNVRFMGLFDTVGSMGLAGNSTDIGYDFSVDSRIGHVAHAVALNEHRALFPLSSVSPNEGADISSGGNIVEQGFVGAHSDIGGGYGDSDLSDIALQWMYHQALSAGVELGDLKDEHKVVEKPVIHDERGWLGKLGNEDRAIYYPNDPDFKPTPTSKCERKVDNRCVQYQAARESERQRTAPQFPDLEHMIQSKPDGNFRGTVNMDLYQVWLDENGVFGDG
ncbi:phospholipase effector Tle1 domain-containing protein, partial [Endozoicomonas sp. ALE010]|uniref:phospholipase effector Tle1 domain-containing protein n=1 Tax=Endozoicomonas sp. ALE010 TaxID=3403081 RepID=UPI003BB6FFEE